MGTPSETPLPVEEFKELPAEKELIAIAAICQHVVGDYKALYDNFEDFQSLWGVAWWEYEVNPEDKIRAWLLKKDTEINRLDSMLIEIVAKEVNLG